MSVELKPGYWRDKRGQTYELFAERDGWWYGRRADPPQNNAVITNH